MCKSLLENEWPISAVLADESVTKVEHRSLDLTSTQCGRGWRLVQLTYALRHRHHSHPSFPSSLHVMERPTVCSSQIILPPARKKVLDILFG